MHSVSLTGPIGCSSVLLAVSMLLAFTRLLEQMMRMDPAEG